MTEWNKAPEVEQVAKPIIASYYPDLAGVDIAYVFRDKAKKKGDKIVGGTCMVKQGLDAMWFYGSSSSADLQLFVIEIAKDVWDDAPPDFREYLVDHELAHTRVERSNGARKLSIVNHDIEEFGTVIQRRGIMTAEHSKFLANVGKPQLELFASNL